MEWLGGVVKILQFHFKQDRFLDVLASLAFNSVNSFKAVNSVNSQRIFGSTFEHFFEQHTYVWFLVQRLFPLQFPPFLTSLKEQRVHQSHKFCGHPFSGRLASASKMLQKYPDVFVGILYFFWCNSVIFALVSYGKCSRKTLVQLLFCNCMFLLCIYVSLYFV